jgi:hypothetical protein
MSKDDSLRDLIERVEKAEGPAFVLDCNVGRVLRPDRDSWPAYTASVDAALSLMPAGRRMSVQQRRSYEPIWVSFMVDGSTEYDATGRAKTLALAITAASLRAHMGTGG